MAEIFHDEVDELAFAVVFRHRVGAAPVNATGNLPVGILVASVPEQEVAHGISVSETEQRGRGERSIANPGTFVRAGAGLDGGAITVDQDVRQRAGDGIGYPAPCGRKLDGGAIDGRRPGAGGDVECPVHRPGASVGQQWCGAGTKGDFHCHRRRTVGRKIESPRQCPRGSTERIMGASAWRYCSAAEIGHDVPRRKRYGAEAVGRRDGDDSTLAVDHDAVAIPIDRIHAAYAAGRPEELPWRVDLEGPECQEKATAQGNPAEVGNPVASDDARRGVRTAGKGGDRERDTVGAPCYRWNRQPLLFQGRRAGNVVPGKQAAVHQQKRLRAERPGAGLEGAVLVEQCLVEAAIDSHDGPVGALADQVAREAATPSVASHDAEERVAGRRRFQRLDPQFPEAETERSLWQREVEAKEAGFGIGEVEVIPFPAPPRPPIEPAPDFAVVGGEDRVVPRRAPRFPGEREPTVLPPAQEVDRDVGARPRRPPAGGGVAVEQCRSGMAGAAGRCAHQRCQVVAAGLGAGGEDQIVEPDAPLATAAACRDDEFDCRDVIERGTTAGSPRKRDLAAPDGDLVPSAIEDPVALGVPPDVLATLVHQLELERVARRLSPDPEREGVVAWQVEGSGPARDGVAAAGKRKIEPQGSAPVSPIAVERHGDAVGRMGGPRVKSFEVVHHSRGERVGRRERQQGTEQKSRDHPFTLPAMMPWM